MMPVKIDSPESRWEKLWAPSGHLAIVTTADAEGNANAGAYGTAVRIAMRPLQIAFTTTSAGLTSRNVEATGEFVFNLPGFERALLAAIRVVGMPGDDRLERSGLTLLGSRRVTAPRIAECGRHFECRLVWFKDWDGRRMIVGEVIAASHDEGALDEDGNLVWDRVKPVATCGGPYVDLFAGQLDIMQVNLPARER